MLNKARLKQEIQQGLEGILPGAVATAFKATMPAKTKNGDEIAEDFGKNLSNLLCSDIADILSSAIDYYVKNANITGTVLTTGSPVTQTAVITSPSPLTNGMIPNSFKLI